MQKGRPESRTSQFLCPCETAAAAVSAGLCKKSPARVLDSTAGQAKRAWAGGQEISELNDKLANNFLAGVLIVAIVIWWLN
jgi:hypothetical protein